MEGLMKVQEVCKLLGVTPETLRNWEKKGRIHPVRTLGNQRRYHREDINKIIGRNTDNDNQSKDQG